MVKYGRHNAASRKYTRFYVIDYEALRVARDRDEFVRLWETGLHTAEAAHREALTEIWKAVFATIASNPSSRGIPAGDALRLCALEGSPEETGALLKVRQLGF